MIRVWLPLLSTIGIGVFTLGGCAQVPPFVPPTLPPEIEVVLNDPASFAMPETSPHDPNAVAVADNAAVSGCWARLLGPNSVDLPTDMATVLGESSASAQLRVIELWQFNEATGAARYEMYVWDENTQRALLQIMSGTFRVRSPGAVAVKFDTFQGNDWVTGELITVPPPDGDWPETLLQFERSGDRLYLLSSDTADDTWVFQHLACPA